MSARSCRAGLAIRSSRPRRPIMRLLAAAPAQGCSPISSSRSTTIICRCTGKPRPSPARASIWNLNLVRRGGATAAALNPLIDALAADVMASDTLHVDDTPVPVLAPGMGEAKTGRLWTRVRDDRPFAGKRPPATLFFYSPDREGEHSAGSAERVPRHHPCRWLRRLQRAVRRATA